MTESARIVLWYFFTSALGDAAITRIRVLLLLARRDGDSKLALFTGGVVERMFCRHRSSPERQSYAQVGDRHDQQRHGVDGASWQIRLSGSR